MNSGNLPLPLELTKPVLLAADLDTQVREGLSDKYDSKAQLCSGTHSNAKSKTVNLLGIQVDVNADVVVDDAGEATWQRSLQAAGTGGRIVVCGATSGPNPPAALHRIWWKQLSVLGSTMGTKEDFEGVYDLVSSGKVRPVVDEVFPLSEARAAHERMEAGAQLGKIVLTIPG